MKGFFALFVFAFTLSVLSAAHLPPLDINQIPAEYRGKRKRKNNLAGRLIIMIISDNDAVNVPLSELIPEEVTKFYHELTEDDKKALKEVAERHEEFQTEEQANKWTPP